MDSFDGLTNGSESSPKIHIPDHELLRVIGRGSYGQVWIARNTIGTYRAVKIIQRSSFQHERPFEREIEGIRRFEPISRTHPGLVAILHVGQTADGNCFYYVMELGDDVKSGAEINPENYEVKSLASAVWDQGRLPVDRCIDLGLSLSDALAYLHSNDLIHRDVKPANIIFVSGYPKLADIGLVTETSTANTYVGTEGFIPPEGPNSEQGDIFSLGKTLYEISTGQDRNQFPSLPATFSDDADESSFVELIEIINQACHHDTAIRYPSARAMHAEITALANGRSIRRLRLLERRMLFLSRFSKIAALVILPLLFIGFFIQQEWQRRIRETHREIGLFEARAARALDDGDYATALRHVSQALDLAPSDERNKEVQQLRIASILNLSPNLTHFWVMDGSVNTVKFDESGDYLFVAGDSGVVSRLTLSDRQVMPFNGHLGDVRGLDYHEESGLLLSAGQDEVVRLWDGASGKSLRTFRHPANLWAVTFSPDGALFASGGDTKEGQDSAYLWRVDQPEEPIAKLPTDSGIRALSFSSDGQWLAVAAGDLLTIWETSTGKLLRSFEHGSRVYDVLFIDGNSRVATSMEGGRYRIWNISSQAVEYVSQKQNFGIRAIDESADSRFLITAGWDSIVRIWDRDGGRLVQPILRHSGRVNTIDCSDSGHRIVTGATDGTIRVWDFAGINLPRRYWGQWDAHHGGYHATVDEGVLKLRKGEEEFDLSLLNQTLDPNRKAMLSEAGTHLFVVAKTRGPTKRVQILDVKSTDRLLFQTDVTFDEEIRMVDFHEGERLLVVAGKKLIQVVPLDPGLPSIPATRFDYPFDRIFLSRSGKELFVQNKKEVLILDSRSLGNRVPPIRTGNEIVFASLSPSGSVLGITESDGSLDERSGFLYRYMETNRPYAELRHRDGVNRLAFHPNEEFVITASEDSTAAIWDFSTGKPTGRVIQHGNGVNDTSFSRDGRYVVTSSGDRTVRVSDAESGFPISPVIRFPWAVDFGAFDLQASLLLCQVSSGTWTWNWGIEPNEFPLELLRRYADVLCGDQLDRVGGVAPIPSPWLEATRLYRQSFDVSEADIIAWHSWHSFDCLMSMVQLPKRYRQIDLERLERAEEFHATRMRELTGKEDPRYESFRGRIRDIVREEKSPLESE